MNTTLQDEVANFHAWLKQRVEWQTEGANNPRVVPDTHGTKFRAIEGETILFFFEDKVMKYMADQKNKGG